MKRAGTVKPVCGKYWSPASACAGRGSGLDASTSSRARVGKVQRRITIFGSSQDQVESWPRLRSIDRTNSGVIWLHSGGLRARRSAWAGGGRLGRRVIFAGRRLAAHARQVGTGRDYLRQVHPRLDAEPLQHVQEILGGQVAGGARRVGAAPQAPRRR